MSDLTDFQEDAVELVCERDRVPVAVLRMNPHEGPEMLLQNGWSDEDEVGPQYDLLAAYVAHLANRTGNSVGEVFEAVDERLANWSEEGVMGFEHEQR